MTIKEAFSNVASIVIADYRGIKVPTVTTMRDAFRKAGCHYRVLKNSLVKIAVKGSRMERLSHLMVGTTAVIWSTEAPQPPAQIALKWAKDEPKFVIRGGYYEGQLLDAAGIDAPGRRPAAACGPRRGGRSARRGGQRASQSSSSAAVTTRASCSTPRESMRSPGCPRRR